MEIISFILIILLSDSEILKLDEIKYWSLFGFKGLSRFTTKDDNLTSQVWLVSLAYCLNLEILIRCRQKFPTKLYTIPFHKEKKKDSSSRNLHRKTIIKGFSREFKNIFRVVTDHMCGVDNRSDQLTKILDFNLTDLQKIQLRDP